MGYVHCCGALRKTRSFVLLPAAGFAVCETDYLKKCPKCGHTVIQIYRISKDNQFSTLRYVNKKAVKLLEKLKSEILYERKDYSYSQWRGRSYYLNYNEYGVKKRCYSNISNLSIGKYSTF